MDDKILSASNKKNAGKGNGNSIISHKSVDNVRDGEGKSTDGYVGGDLFPSSTGHTFHDKTQNENKN